MISNRFSTNSSLFPIIPPAYPIRTPSPTIFATPKHAPSLLPLFVLYLVVCRFPPAFSVLHTCAPFTLKWFSICFPLSKLEYVLDKLVRYEARQRDYRSNASIHSCADIHSLRKKHSRVTLYEANMLPYRQQSIMF